MGSLFGVSPDALTKWPASGEWGVDGHLHPLAVGTPSQRVQPLPRGARTFPTPDTGHSLTGHGARGGRVGNGRQSGASLEAIARWLYETYPESE